MAYVPQEAWVQNMSVVETVCFRQELDPPWLERVLEACALWPDVGSSPAGLHTQIGEQVSLGGPSWDREALQWGAICFPDLCGRDKGETGRQGHGGEKGPSLGPSTQSVPHSC